MLLTADDIADHYCLILARGGFTVMNKFSFQWITQQEGICEDGWFKSELVYLKQL
jgi:hypothetical protein